MSTKEGTNIHKCLESFRYKRFTESWKSLPSVALSIHKIYLLVQSDENNVDFNSRAVCELTVNSSYELDTHLLSVMSLKNLPTNEHLSILYNNDFEWNVFETFENTNDI